MKGGLLAFAMGIVIAVVISNVQRIYPDLGFGALLGVGLACGALLNLAMFVASKILKRS